MGEEKKNECRPGHHIWVMAYPEDKVNPDKSNRTWFYCIKCYKRKE